MARKLRSNAEYGNTRWATRRALWRDRKLVKTWLMRGTLHLVPADDLPVFTAAMSSHLVRSPAAWLKYTQLTEREFTDVIQAIGDALDGQALTREELIAKVGKGRSERIQIALKSGWGGLLKPVARKGMLCFGPSRGQSVTFVQPRQWLGRWRDLDPEAALVEMGRRYLRAYGPATKNDFACYNSSHAAAIASQIRHEFFHAPASAWPCNKPGRH